MSSVNLTPLFTRYLYIKNDVVWSLFHSIVWRDIEQSLFWAYELYHSGFQEEVFELMQYIFDECYHQTSTYSPLVHKKLQQIYDEWKETPNKDWLLATYIVNIIYRPHDMMAFIKKYDYAAYIREALPHEVMPAACAQSRPNPKKKIVFVKYEEKDIKGYKTVLPSNKCKASQLLNEVRKYDARTNGAECCECLRNTFMGKYMDLPYSREEIDAILQAANYKWLYYASATPLWAQRLQSHKGIPNHDTKIVKFHNDIMKLSFLGKYGLVLSRNAF